MYAMGIANCKHCAYTMRMRTLYLRNVPDDVGAQLEELAARAGMSLSAFAVRELSEVARLADNPALLGALPDLGVAAIHVVDALEESRRAR